MRNLINFILKYNHWFLFILIELAGFLLLFRFNNYQHSVFFSSANAVTGMVYRLSGEVHAYFGLKATNEELLTQNLYLRNQVVDLKRTLADKKDSVAFSLAQPFLPKDVLYRKAHVIKNSIHLPKNYITLDKGANDGIKPEMGVVSTEGVVGIVYAVSPSFSVVLSILNAKSNISCKVLRSNYFGYLRWKHGDTRHAFLEDLPRHAEISVGDTVVTSGYSTVFPEGFPVGVITHKGNSGDATSYELQVQLFADFGRLSNVRVLEKLNVEEQKQLERKIERQ